MSEAETRWIRTEQESDLLNCLEHCQLVLTLAHTDVRNWKWCVSAAHSAAQTAMVIVLEGTNEHLTPRSRKRLEEYIIASQKGLDKPYPHTRLAEFMPLYDDCQKHLPPGVATGDYRRELERLNT